MHLSHAEAAPGPLCFDEGHGPVVVLLHGSMGTRWQWRALRARLAAHWRVIAPDGPGAGFAPPAPLASAGEGGFAAELAHLWCTLERRIGDAPVHLVGHGFGGAVALHAALARPQRVESLVLFEPNLFGLLPADDHELPALRLFADAARDAEPLSATRRHLAYWHGADRFDELPPLRRLALAGRLPKALRDLRAQLDDGPAAAQLRRLFKPVCLVKGQASPGCARRAVDALARRLPLRGVHELPGGHMAPIDAPGPFNALVERFLAAGAERREGAPDMASARPGGLSSADTSAAHRSARRLPPASARSGARARVPASR